METLNVVTQRADPRSMPAHYGRLVALRREETALHGATLEPLRGQGEVVASRGRSADGRRHVLIALDLGSSAQEFGHAGGGRELLSTHLDREGERISTRIALRPDEGMVIGTTEGDG